MEDRPRQQGRDRSVHARFGRRLEMNVPNRHNEKLRTAIERVNRDDDLYALWVASNVTAVERLGMTDHGPVHVKIVMNIGVKMLRLLFAAGVEPGVSIHYGLTQHDAEVVVALAALMHDLGMAIHRQDHESFSLFLAHEKLGPLLVDLYDEPTAAIVRAEILHAITAHRSGGQPLTLEAGVVRLADALDMAEGRSRIPFEAGSMSIHSVSAAAIEGVRIEEGESLPVRIVVEMNNSAGVFQLDQLLREKLNGSGLEPYIEVQAALEGETEKRLISEFHL